jgi:4-hydroxy-3-polyprenylbenzoate decarboxylase
MRPFFNIKCITHRKKPIWVASVSQYPPSESSKIRQYATEGVIFKRLRYDLKMEHVLQVAVFDAIGSFNFIAVKCKRTSATEIQHTLTETAKLYQSARIVVALDEDVNLRDMDSVILAICIRSKPSTDFRIVKMPAMSTTDPFMRSPEKLLPTPERKHDVEDEVESSCLMIDATSKQPLPPLSLPKKEFMEEALRIWQEEGLPKLQLKEPWWGINLGVWNDEWEKLAKAAVEGDCYKTGELYSQRRRSIG